MTSDTAADPTADVQTRLTVVLFSDIVGSTQLKSRLGDVEYFKMLDRHNELFASGVAEMNGAKCIKHTGDGYLSEFRTASDAVRFALKFQSRMKLEPWGAWPLESRVGIHQGEVIDTTQAGQCDLIGAAVDTAARVMSLGLGGQILLTQQVFNDARQHLIGPRRERDAPPLTWLSHGPYQFKGIEDPLTVCEVGISGISPLTHPPNNAKAHRMLPRDKESAEAESGWRPAVSLEIPGRSGWVLKRKLGDGGFGEVWLASHSYLGEDRVFKFCFDGQRLRSFKREVTLVRLMNKTLGDRSDIARLHDLKVDEPPFFIESDYVQGGDLLALAERSGGIATLPLPERLELIAKVADTVAAAHSVGVLHKDIKPSNILIRQQPGGVIQPILSDFGIGQLADPSQLEMLSTAAFSLTQLNITGGDSNAAGTQMYSPPESLLHKPFTTQGDVYALGVLLYQIVVGDLNRPLAVGWERQIDDELLRKDIAEMVEGDPKLRIATANIVAERIRTLDERRLAQSREREAVRRARRRSATLKFAGAGLGALVVISVMLGLFAWRQNTLRRQADAANDALKQSIGLFIDVLGNKSASGFLHPASSQGALESLQRLVQRCEQTLGTDHPTTVRLRTSVALLNINQRSRWPELTKSFTADLARLQAQAPDRVTNAEVRLTIVLAGLQTGGGESTAAASTLQTLLDKAARLGYGKTAGSSEELSVLSVRSEMALVLRDQSRFDDAARLEEAVVADCARDFGEDDIATRITLDRLAQIHESAGRFDQAADVYRRVIVSLTRTAGKDAEETLRARLKLAWRLIDQHADTDADKALAELVPALQQALGKAHSLTLSAQDTWAKLLVRTGSVGQAETILRQSLAARQMVAPTDSAALAEESRLLAETLRSQKKTDQAVAVATEGLRHAAAVQPVDHALLGACNREIASDLEAAGRAADALAYRGAAADEFAKVPESQRTPTALPQALVELGQNKRLSGDYAGAERYFNASLATVKSFGADPAAITVRQAALRGLIEAYRAWNKPEEAARIEAQLKEISP